MELNLSGISNESDENQTEKVIIIGSGPAGLAAALYAARADLQPLVFSGMQLGGQAALTDVIENYPGFPEGLGGAELGELFKKHAERFGARIVFDHVTEVNLSIRPFIIKTYSKEYRSETLIVALGASPNHLNIPGEKEFFGHGISYCATCDGWFFRNKKVVVVGGGDSALEEGLFLTRFATSVTIVHRRNQLRAGAILERRARENPKIGFLWETEIIEIKGEKTVESVLLKNRKTGEATLFPTDGVFIFIGHKPNTKLFKDELELDENGYFVTDMTMSTRIPGVFVAGEVADPYYRQVVTSAAMGAAAAMQATRFLEQMEKQG